MSSSSRRQALLSTINSKAAQKLEVRTQELYQIMDDRYMPSSFFTSPERRNSKHNYTIYVDADGHLHDVDYRPFAHPNKSPCPSPRPRCRSQPSSPAYWETFKIPRAEEERDVDPFGLQGFRYERHVPQISPFEPSIGTYSMPSQHDYSPVLGARTGKTSFIKDRNNRASVERNIDCRRKSEKDEFKVGETHRSRKETKDERTAKEKLHHKFVETSLSVRLSAIRTQRWLREHVHPRE